MTQVIAPILAQSSVLEHQISYWDNPSQVIWVDLGHRRLQGFDNYWINSSSYGVWQDEENIGTMYTAEGQHAHAFKWVDGFEIEIEPTSVPDDAVVYQGYMLTDEQARFVGLI